MAIRFDSQEVVLHYHTKLDQWNASTAVFLKPFRFVKNTQYNVVFVCTLKEWTVIRIRFLFSFIIYMHKSYF